MLKKYDDGFSIHFSFSFVPMTTYICNEETNSSSGDGDSGKTLF